MSPFGPLQKLTRTLLASGALMRISTRELLSTRGYCASRTLDVAGLKSPESCARQNGAASSATIVISRIAPPDIRGRALVSPDCPDSFGHRRHPLYEHSHESCCLSAGDAIGIERLRRLLQPQFLQPFRQVLVIDLEDDLKTIIHSGKDIGRGVLTIDRLACASIETHIPDHFNERVFRVQRRCRERFDVRGYQSSRSKKFFTTG